MSDHVHDFSELIPEQQPAAGGKGGMLARLYQAGYPVPNGFVILPGAFEQERLSPSAWQQVKTHLQAQRSAGGENRSFAVRSSGLSEDSARASFAGEFETVLDVRTDREIRAAINKVYQSRLSERVRAYSQARGIAPDHQTAVVVQNLVNADYSGILFTVDPVSGRASKLTGNYVAGSGDQLVSGTVNGQAFELDRPGGSYRGPFELERFAQPLFRLGDRLEKELGLPQDIEWAISEGKLYLLQSRPITTLASSNQAHGRYNDSLTGDFLWSNVNLGEAIPDVMTPFTWSVIRQGAIGEWLSFQGRRSIGNIGGRPYFNISIFASILRLLGQKEAALQAQIEGLLYTHFPPGTEIPVLPAPKREAWPVLRLLLGVQWRQRRDVKQLPGLLAKNPDWCRETGQRIEQVESGPELVNLWRERLKPYSSRAWSAFLSTTNYYGDYTTKLRRRLTGLVGPDDADILISGLSDETGLLASLGPLMGLSQLAQGKLSRAEFLQAYGHRGPQEFEFSQPRPAEDPSWLEQQLADFQKSPVDIEAMLGKRRADFSAALSRLQQRQPGQVRRLRRQIERIGPRARLREAIRSEFGQVTWLFRLWALRAGQISRLGEQIFYLELEEILDLLNGDRQALVHIEARQQMHQLYQSLPPYPAVIRGRFNPIQWAADPQRRSDIFDDRQSQPDDLPGEQVIHGAAGAAGQAQGRVRLLTDLAEGHQLQPGEILVTGQTNIGWTPLFPRAAAIITDVGAPLSHAAIVARELGIPAVVGCGNATMRLRSGDRVHVDGGQGQVRILERLSAENGDSGHPHDR